MTPRPKKPSNKTLDTTPKILSQEELVRWWPFHRVNGKSLESLHKKQVVEQVEQALF